MVIMSFTVNVSPLTSSSETTAANQTNETTPSVRHDILEVNKYIMSGLVVSSIDKWFMGPVPQFIPQDLGIPGTGKTLQEVLKQAREVANDPSQVAWQYVRRYSHFSVDEADIDRINCRM